MFINRTKILLQVSAETVLKTKDVIKHRQAYVNILKTGSNHSVNVFSVSKKLVFTAFEFRSSWRLLLRLDNGKIL